jgi:DNA polymerase-3 subunit beta
MKFQIDRNKLLQALQKVGEATRKPFSWRNGAQFHSYIFRAGEKSLTVEATDGEIFMRQKVAISNADGTKDFALIAHKFIKAIKSLDSQELTIEILEYQLIVTHSTGNFALPLENDLVPIFDNVNKIALDYSRVHRFAFEAPGLFSILTKCKYAMAEDELRPVMNGVCMSLKEDYTDFVASDGHKLIRIRKKSITDNRPADFVFPHKVVNILLRTLPKTGFVDIWFNEYDFNWKAEEHPNENPPVNGCLMSIDGTEIIFRPIPGRYPNYNSVIPTVFSKELTIDRKQLLKSVERLSQFSADSGLIRLNLNPNRLLLQADDKDFETKGSEVLTCTYSGDVFRFGLKDVSLIQTLRNSVAPEMLFKGSDASRAFIIEPTPQPDSEEITMLLMPMLVND